MNDAGAGARRRSLSRRSAWRTTRYPELTSRVNLTSNATRRSARLPTCVRLVGDSEKARRDSPLSAHPPRSAEPDRTRTHRGDPHTSSTIPRAGSPVDLCSASAYNCNCPPAADPDGPFCSPPPSTVPRPTKQNRCGRPPASRPPAAPSGPSPAVAAPLPAPSTRSAPSRPSPLRPPTPSPRAAAPGHPWVGGLRVS
jgi:hypothetical protein